MNKTTAIAIIVIIAILMLIAIFQSVIAPRFRDFIGKMRRKHVVAGVTQAIKALHGLPFEASFVIDDNGQNVYDTTQYQEGEVTFTDEQIARMQSQPGMIWVHNHTEDIPPSMRDLVFAGRIQCASCVVVSPSYVYFVAPSINGWKTEEQVNDAMMKHLDLFKRTRVGHRFIGVEPDGAWLYDDVFDTQSTDAAIQAVVDDLSYIYNRFTHKL